MCITAYIYIQICLYLGPHETRLIKMLVITSLHDAWIEEMFDKTEDGEFGKR